MPSRELLAAHPDNMTTLLKHTIYNELSQARNPHNMAVLGAVFQHSGQQAAAVLADVFLVSDGAPDRRDPR